MTVSFTICVDCAMGNTTFETFVGNCTDPSSSPLLATKITRICFALDLWQIPQVDWGPARFGLCKQWVTLLFTLCSFKKMDRSILSMFLVKSSNVKMVSHLVQTNAVEAANDI